MIKKVALGLFLILALTSCSFFQVLPQVFGGAQTDTANTTNIATEEGATQEDVSPTPEANPLNIEMALDTAAVVEQEIGQEGGTITATSADGAVYKLVIPPDALLSPETIRMTPASSISGLPFEDPAPAGVRLEPEGLIFFKAVSLEIQPASIQEGLEWVGFGTDTGGQDFHLQPSVEQDGVLHLSLVHFSDYGMAQARKEEVGRLSDSYTPSVAQNNAMDQVSTVVDLVDDPTAQLDAITKVMRNWFNNSVLVRIQNAAVFDDRLDAAVGEFLAWKNWVEDLDLLFGFDNQLKENLRDELIQGLDELAASFKNAFEKSSERCTSNKDPEEAFRMYRYGLVATYLQLWGRSSLDQAEAKSMLVACFKFDYLFRSKVVVETDNGTKTSQVMARIPLTIDESSDIDSISSILTEKGPLTFEINTLSNIPGYCQLNSKSGELSVSVIFKLNYSQYNPWSISDIHVMMLISNRPEESITCTTQGQTVSSLLLTWRPMFQAANQAFFDGAFMELDLPIVKKGEVFAELELYGPIPNVPSSDESSTYQIIHTP